MTTQLPVKTPDSNTIEGELTLYQDTHRHMRIALLTLGVALGGFLLWAILAPLDEGVPTQGSVSLDMKRKAVQHLTGGIVKEILVREGDQVEAGQVVARLDTAVSKANFESTRQHYMGLSAMQSRLEAEQIGIADIRFTDEVLSSDDAMVQDQVSNQRALFKSRRAALDAELRGLRETMAGQEALVRALESQLSSSQQQLKLLKEELQGISDLVSEGYAPRNRQSELERASASIQGAIAEIQGNRARARSSIAELQQRILQRQIDYRKEGESQMAQIRMELQADLEKFRASSDDLGRTELRAPVAGQVVGLAVHTVGGVIQPAQKLMDIVPHEENLIIETRILPHLIDRLAPGQVTDIRFSAFAHSPALVVEGRVESISSDLIVEQGPTGSFPYYLARISVTPDGTKTLGLRRMQPGMPAEVIIKTGERSLLTYLLNPLLKRIATSMKEE